MVQITIQIDGDKVIVNQSDDPTKVEQKNKKFFIIIGNKDEKSWIEFVSDDYITAINRLKNLEMYRESSEPHYTFFIQDENENIKCCNGNIRV